MIFKSKSTHIRQVNFSDLNYLLRLENDSENWKFSDTKTPYTEEEIIDFIVEQSDLKSTNELRLMICLNSDNTPIGTLDLFNIDFQSGSASVGILIDENFRKNGHATEALYLLQKDVCDFFSFKELNCTIQSDNFQSVQLFTKCGFVLQKTEGKIGSYRFTL